VGRRGRGRPARASRAAQDSVNSRPSRRVHLLMGAGGIRCLSYIGALDQLEREAVEIATVSTCSAGTLVGTLCCGVRADAMREATLNLDRGASLATSAGRCCAGRGHSGPGRTRCTRSRESRASFVRSWRRRDSIRSRSWATCACRSQRPPSTLLFIHKRFRVSRGDGLHRTDDRGEMLVDGFWKGVEPLQPTEVVLHRCGKLGGFDAEREEPNPPLRRNPHLTDYVGGVVRRRREQTDRQPSSAERRDDRAVAFRAMPDIARRDPARHLLGLKPPADEIRRLPIRRCVRDEGPAHRCWPDCEPLRM
jgi:hypothetical protein